MTHIYTVGGEFRVAEKYGDLIEIWKEAVKQADPFIKCTFIGTETDPQYQEIKIVTAAIAAMRDIGT